MTETPFVRHGETAWNAEDRIQGWAPVSLSDRGRKEADLVAEELAATREIDVVVSSDLPRAIETAEAVADAVGVAVETDPRLRERDFGVYQGLRSADLFDRFPEMDLLERGRDAAAYTPESGESWLDVRDRVMAAADDLLTRTEAVVAVTHVNPIRLVVGEYGDDDVVRSLTERSADNCSVTVIDSDDGVVRENAIDHLDR